MKLFYVFLQAVAIYRTCKKDQEHITYRIKELPRSYKGFGRPQVLLGSSLFMFNGFPEAKGYEDIFRSDPSANASYGSSIPIGLFLFREIER